RTPKAGFPARRDPPVTVITSLQYTHQTLGARRFGQACCDNEVTYDPSDSLMVAPPRDLRLPGVLACRWRRLGLYRPGRRGQGTHVYMGVGYATDMLAESTARLRWASSGWLTARYLQQFGAVGPDHRMREELVQPSPAMPPTNV